MAALRLRSLASPRFLRFAAVGASGVFVNLGALYVFADVIGIADVASSALAIEISIIWNFLLNDAWTFRDKREDATAGFGRRMMKYNVVSLFGMVLQIATFVAVHGWTLRMGFHRPDWVGRGFRAIGLPPPDVYKLGAQLVGIGLATVWNFVSNFYWTWAQKRTAA